MVANEKVVEYIKNQLMLGQPIEEIEKTLLKQGWSENDIEEAIDVVMETTEPRPVVRTVAPPPPPTPPVSQAKPTTEQKSSSQKEEKKVSLNSGSVGFAFSVATGISLLLYSLYELIPDIEMLTLGISDVLGTYFLKEIAFIPFATGLIITILAFLAYMRSLSKLGLVIIGLSVFLFLIEAPALIVILGIVAGLLITLKI